MLWTGKYSRGASVLAFVCALAACSPPTAQNNQQALAAPDNAGAILPPLPAAMPLVEGPAGPVRTAPAAHALPRVRNIGYARAPDDERYAWIDRADRISDMIGDAPPDYAFDYDDGVEPYGWESAGGYRTYVEPIDDGYRYYYYDPGADEPYLVRDPDYSYGYSSGRIVTIYDRGGRALGPDYFPRQQDSASRYYERARALRAAADARQRRGVIAAQWAQQRALISRQRAQWRDDAQWRAYRTNHAQGDRRLMAEQLERAQAARHFATWQDQDFRGSAPRLYGPAQGVGVRDHRYIAQQQALNRQRAQQGRQQMAAQQARTAQAVALRQRQDAVVARQRQLQQAQAAQQRAAQIRATQQARLGQQRAVQARAQNQQAVAQANRARVVQQHRAIAQQQAKQRAVQQQAVVQRKRQLDQAAQARQAAAQARKASQQTGKTAQLAAIRQRQQAQAMAQRNAAIARQNQAHRVVAVQRHNAGHQARPVTTQ